MPNKLNMRLLEVFRAVMDANSVTDAAEMLNISQPAVSKALGQLEGNLNLQLFGRTHGRLHPTGDAHRLYAESERLFIQVNTFRDRVSRLSSGRDGKLIVTAIPTLATSLVTHAAAKFGKERPNVKIHVVTANAADVAESVGRHRCDIGLLHSPVTDKTVTGNIIGESEIVAVMPENSPLSKLKRVTPADLDGVPLILNDSGSPPIHLLYEAFAAARVEIHAAMEANSSAVCNTAVLPRHGIALIDPWPNHPTPVPGVILRQFRPRIPLRIMLVNSVFQPPTKLAEAFSDILAATLREASRSSPFISVR
jgi:DNA-binding transcriptional LysR family regulator